MAAREKLFRQMRRQLRRFQRQYNSSFSWERGEDCSGDGENRGLTQKPGEEYSTPILGANRQPFQ
jgi:hypothetical protein